MAGATWLITGSSRGFGRALVEAALEAGERVVATARRPDQLADLVDRYGDRVLTVALDVTDATQVRAAFDAAVARFGGVDVVVNNAGFANLAPVETGTEEDFRRQFETNFWGVYHVSRAAVPILKAQGGGTIVQFSSVGGRVGGTPGLASYQAAKFAVDGFTRTLAVETAPFGLRFLTIEPGGFDTDWAGASMEVQEIPDEYVATVGSLAGHIASGATAAGDPRRAAEIIVRVVRSGEPPSHLLLGELAVTMSLDYSREQIAQASAWRDLSVSADFGREYPVALPA
ncbi:MAG: SDR family NAD(P)-dependent oxidoreductase [Nocardioides sp.]